MQKLTFAMVEERLVREGGYPGTLEAAFWAVEQGPRIVPHLATLLQRLPRYAKAAADGGSLFAFPFNTIWALGRLPGKAAARVLSQFRSATQEKLYRAMADFALQAHTLREQHKDSKRAVFGDGGLPELRAQASESATIVVRLRPGTAIKVLREMVENRNEEGPRGGWNVFDEVQVLPSGPRGFLMRAGDQFPPYY